MGQPVSADLVVSMRPCRAEDEPFLFKVYSSTRTNEMALVPWTQEQKDAFLHMQFNAQYRHYAANFPDAQFLIILKDHEPIGRLYLHRVPREILILDIAILPEYRNMGIGTLLIRGMQAEAHRANSIIRLHVESSSQAKAFYERLGFVTTSEIGFYYEMIWQPEVEMISGCLMGEYHATRQA